MPGFRLQSAPRSLDSPQEMALTAIGLWLGRGNGPLEIAAYRSQRRPTEATLTEAYRKRRGGRATPVLVIVESGDPPDSMCALVGPTGEDPISVQDLTTAQAIAICKAAADQPDRHTATRFLMNAMGSLGSAIPGLNNEGFLAKHELKVGVPQRGDWGRATARAAAIMAARGRDLVCDLGYVVQDDPSGKHSLLFAADRKAAVALYLNREEEPELAAARFSDITPISYALAVADRENLDHVIITTPTSIRIYPSKPGFGVAQRGRTETYVDLNLNVLSPSQAGYLWLLYSADATKTAGTLSEILEASTRFRSGLEERLRERVYDEVIPGLATEIARARSIRQPKAEDLQSTYEMALHHLFRLLFISYAEDKDLLPYATNDAYQSRSLKRKAEELLEARENGIPFGETNRLWKEVEALCNAIDKGDASIGVPAYNGGLFSTDPTVSSQGAELARISLSDRAYAPILTALLIDEADGTQGPVDFRSLGVREFGTIYEGLLESELSLADVALVADADTGTYRPANAKEIPSVKPGAYYLAGTSGARKASGSYFTKDFAVKHLLQHALEPALTDHLRRLNAMKDPDQAAAAFFDFRVADISMGSGHFLVAAIDEIEVRLSSYLASRDLPAIRAELQRLRNASRVALGDIGLGEIEDARLLRRQIARRCIYGVDLKPAAVELARVSIWIHTFVPGLPLSLLDQHLVVGNSLTGIGTVEEAERLLSGGKAVVIKSRQAGKLNVTGKTQTQFTIFSTSAKELMRQAAAAMLEVARLGDATTAEVNRAREEWDRARRAAEPWAALLDILAAGRLDEAVELQAQRIYEEWTKSPSAILTDGSTKRARNLLRDLMPCHFPVVFPEVFFGRRRSGFDVILGNPPWEEVTVEEDKFWIRVMPGLAGLSQREQEKEKNRLRRERPDLVARYQESVAAAELTRRLLVASDYPGMGTGDPDLYKAFAWRFWRLLAIDGYIGVVLPRSAMAAKGSADWRRALFNEGIALDLTFLLNRGGWVFDDAEPRYTICLTSFQKSKPTPDTPMKLRGPFATESSYRAGVRRPATSFSLATVLSWTDTASLPLLPDSESVEVFSRMRASPRLDSPEGDWVAQPHAEFHATQDKKAHRAKISWRAEPYRELDGTNDKKEKGGVIEFPGSPPDGYWPVYGGESFDIWNPDTGSYYGWADAQAGLDLVYSKRRASAKRELSIFSGLSQAELTDYKSLPCQQPRIAFRDIARATDSRTVRVALVPPRVFLTNKAPFFVWGKGDQSDQAYFLGVLSSLPLDWYARRFVEIGMNFFVIRPFPVPRPERTDSRWKRVVQLAGRLASPDVRFKSWARAVGVDCGPIDLKAKDDMIHELDAVVAHLYGLTREHLVHIFETFHEGWDYHSRMDATLKLFDTWGKKA